MGATHPNVRGGKPIQIFSSLWQIVTKKHKVNHSITAPTAIRASKQIYPLQNNTTLSSIKGIGLCGEPINEEAWHWYNDL